MTAEWPLAGRDAVLADVGQLLASPRAHVALIAGEAGIGKTRLVRESADRAAGAGFTVLRATGHRSSSAIPFGALAQLLPSGQEMVASGVPLLRQAADALRLAAGGHPIVLAVDDAHLLDDASAVLVYQLVAAREVFAIVAVRSDEPAPDAISGLLRDGYGARIELRELGRPDVEALLTAALGGVVAAATVDALLRSSGGSPMVLGELVRGSLEAQTLTRDRDLWRLRGALAASAPLREFVGARLSGLNSVLREALEVIAVAEPLGPDDAVALGATDLERLERDGLITATVSGRRTVLSVTQTAISDQLRADLPPLRGRTLRRSVAQRLTDLGARRRGDELRLALLLVDLDDSTNGAVLASAARDAFVANDFVTTVRLARASQAIASDPAVGQLLATSLYRLGIADPHVASASEATDQQRALQAINQAAALYWHLGDRAGADEVLGAAIEALAPCAWRDELIAMWANLDINSGDPNVALERLQGVAILVGRPLIMSALVTTLALPQVGRSAQALGALGPARLAYANLGDAVAMFPVNLLISTESTIEFELGRLHAATDIATSGYERSTADHDTAGQAFNALVLGRVLLARGRAASALRWFREAQVLFDAIGHRGPRRWALGGVAMAAAARGDLSAARTALDQIDAEPDHPARMLEPDITRGRVWLAVADGDPVGAREILAGAQAECRRHGLIAHEIVLLHESARLDAAKAVVERMTLLAGDVEGEWLPALAADARARAARTVSGLIASADVLAGLGANLLAAETATCAAAEYAAGGNQREATAWRRRASELLAECEGTRSPGVVQADGPVPLTDREREIALLAASGLTSKTISDRLFLSVRTVDNNLARVYTKLGIAERSRIGQALGID